MKLKPFSEINKRVLAGVILAPLTLVLIWLGGGFFMTFMLAALIVSLSELYRLCMAAPHPALNFTAGMIYLCVSFLSYVVIRMGFDQGAWLATCAMLGVWASDTGAFAVGKTLKGPKLAPVISPNKTWAGLAGAVVFFGLAFLLLLYGGPHLKFLVDTKLTLRFENDAWKVFSLGCFLGAVGQAGDLLKSRYKRRAGVKNSGALIPGHGGILDRIDALLLVAPVFLIVLLVWTS